MYAIIQTGGKQYLVKQGDEIDVELLDQEPGASVSFQEVLFVNDGTATHVGNPVVEAFAVNGVLLENTRGEKITSVKYKRRKNQKVKFGHRQELSRVKITDISGEKKSVKGIKVTSEESTPEMTKAPAEKKVEAAAAKPASSSKTSSAKAKKTISARANSEN